MSRLEERGKRGRQERSSSLELDASQQMLAQMGHSLGESTCERRLTWLSTGPVQEYKHRMQRSREVMLDGVAGGGGSRADAQFVVKRTHMGFDGEQANNQLFGNLCVTEPLRHQPQHLHFACGQPIRVVGGDFSGSVGCASEDIIITGPRAATA